MTETTVTRRRGIPRSNTPVESETPLASAETEQPEPEKKTLRRRAPQTTTGISGGWDAFTAARTPFSKNFKTPVDKPGIIKFLEEGPFATYREHWIDGRPKNEDNTNKRASFACLGDDCPLCDELNHKPRLQVCFNVLDMTTTGTPEARVWKVTAQPAEMIRKLAQQPRSQPLNRLNIYFAISRSGSAPYGTSIEVVKDKDLLEDWERNPVTAEQVDDLSANLADASSIKFPTIDEMNEVVAEVAAQD